VPPVPTTIEPVELVDPPDVCVGVSVVVCVGDDVVPVGLGDADGDGEGVTVTDGVGVTDGTMSVGMTSPSSARAIDACDPSTDRTAATSTQRNAIDRPRGLAITHAFPAVACLTPDGEDPLVRAHEISGAVPVGSGAPQSSGRWSGMMKSHGSTSKPSCLCRAWQIS
jgi:hypothetical protein